MSIAKLGIPTLRPKVITRVTSSLPAAKLKDKVEGSKTSNPGPDNCLSTINLVETEVFKLTDNDGEILKILRKSGKVDIKFCGHVIVEGSTEEVENYKVKIKNLFARDDNTDVTTDQKVKEEAFRIEEKPKQFSKINTVKLEVSDLGAIFIYGNEGKEKKAIQLKTGTKINILGRIGDMKRTVEITGPERQVNISKHMINVRIEARMKGLVGQLKDDDVGFLLRNGGKAAIERKTNTWIIVMGKKGDDKRDVFIEGSDEDESKAWSMILNHLNFTLVGQLENNKVGCLLREGGKAMRVIEKNTNTLINFRGKKGDSKRDVVIAGSEEGMSKAWSMILQHLSL